MASVERRTGKFLSASWNKRRGELHWRVGLVVELTRSLTMIVATAMAVDAMGQGTTARGDGAAIAQTGVQCSLRGGQVRVLSRKSRKANVSR